LSYQAQAQLSADGAFIGRSQSAASQQAATYINDARPDFVAVAQAVLRGDTDLLAAFTRLDAAGPGIAEKVDNGDGTIDQSKVTDDDLLSLTQANWQVIAGLYFDEEGTPINV
jgi:hypothetical protein